MPKVTTSRVKIGIQVFQVSSAVLFLLDLDSPLPIKFSLTWVHRSPPITLNVQASSKMELGGVGNGALERGTSRIRPLSLRTSGVLGRFLQGGAEPSRNLRVVVQG